jgi:hypothetical protein
MFGAVLPDLPVEVVDGKELVGDGPRKRRRNGMMDERTSEEGTGPIDCSGVLDMLIGEELDRGGGIGTGERIDPVEDAEEGRINRYPAGNKAALEEDVFPFLRVGHLPLSAQVGVFGGIPEYQF